MPDLIFRVTAASAISFVLGVGLAGLRIPEDFAGCLLVGTCSAMFAANQTAAEHGHLLLLDPIAATWRWARRMCLGA